MNEIEEDNECRQQTDCQTTWENDKRSDQYVKKISLEQLTHKIKSEIPKKGILHEELICSSKRSLTFIQMYMFAGKSINSEMMF